MCGLRRFFSWFLFKNEFLEKLWCFVPQIIVVNNEFKKNRIHFGRYFCGKCLPFAGSLISDFIRYRYLTSRLGENSR